MVNIKVLRKKANLSQAELAERLNVNQTAVSKWELGRTLPDADTLSRLADIFDISIDQILGRESVNDVYFPTYVDDLIQRFKPVRIQRLPMLGNIAAGKPIFANEEHEIMVETIIRADFCLTVCGDSMIGAGILDGDVVMIRKQPIVQNGEIAAVLIDDEATLKRFYKTDTLVTLISENPAYPPIVYKAEDGRDILILGKAVGLTRIFK